MNVIKKFSRNNNNFNNNSFLTFKVPKSSNGTTAQKLHFIYESKITQEDLIWMSCVYPTILFNWMRKTLTGESTNVCSLKLFQYLIFRPIFSIHFAKKLEQSNRGNNASLHRSNNFNISTKKCIDCANKIYGRHKFCFK